MAYDSFYDRLNTSQKKALLEAIKNKGGEMYENFNNRMENHIADNHVWQMTLRILTMAAFSVYGDLPEANTWVDYCYNVWLARFRIEQRRWLAQWRFLLYGQHPYISRSTLLL